MVLTSKEKYFQKVYDLADDVECACGCGTLIKNKDRFGRNKKFVSGHNGRKYTDPSQYKREWNHRNQPSRYDAKQLRGRKLKSKIVTLMGGKCEDCGIEYNGKNASIFQMHHKNPSEKEFVINTRTLVSYAWKRIESEIPKCKLVCANCHFIEHNEEY